MKNIIVTGGCGFIGINLINLLLKQKTNNVLNLDSLTNTSMPEWLNKHKNNSLYNFKKVDISKKIN